MSDHRCFFFRSLPHKTGTARVQGIHQMATNTHFFRLNERSAQKQKPKND